MRVGFVGLGAMGLPMTRNLIENGHSVTVASRSGSPVERAVAFGAVGGGDPAGVVRAAELTVICVPDSPDVVDVVDKMTPALVPGKIVVDCSTIDPEIERAQHARVEATGASYLEAPVSGGTTGAEAGTLTLMVGGQADVLERARPALEAFSSRIVHVGGPGMGQVVKLCNNLLYAAQMLGVAESTALAVSHGVDPADLLDVLTHSTGDCTALRQRLPVAGVIPSSPASNAWRPGFRAHLMAKDLRLAVAAGERAGVPMQGTRAVLDAVSAASAAGYGDEDFSALAKLIVPPIEL